MQGATIILVEDNPILQELYAERFELAGITVLQAFDGQQALDIAEEHPEANLVLLDLMLPVMSGFDVLAQLKRNPATRHLPVIIVSALAEVGDRAKGLQLGAVDYITKGDVLPMTVIDRITKLVEQQKPKRATTNAA